ncbi:MAG: alpha-E domain-containing protein [Rhodospirillales bacterium]|nr:alpha-E domain-containing protein [Rhodospirillales bacterium]
MDSLLARFAENAFWIGRYMERTENLARILDVNETFSRDSTEDALWRPILQLHGEEDIFLEQHQQATANEVVHYYLLDRNGVNSVRTCLEQARENARSMRHLIGTEMWRHLNMLHRWLIGLNRRDIRLDKLTRVCGRIKEGSQFFTGILEGTLHRDQVWYFIQLGKAIERAGQTTRLIDMKSYILMREGEEAAGIDISQWNTILRSVAAYHAFRRVHPRGMNGQQVVAFLLMDPAFPRSVARCVHDVDNLLYGLRRHAGLKQASTVRKGIDPLMGEIHAGLKGGSLKHGLTDRIDRIQIHLNDLSDEITAAFFR